MVGSHAQIEHVEQIEGVPYIVLPSSGKDPYGTRTTAASPVGATGRSTRKTDRASSG